MSDAPTSRFSRVMTYPIPFLPWRRSRPINVRDAIAKSDLPATAQQLITDVVRRTRLWRGEKAEVALELIAHFKDGLEASRSADELISSFGSAKTAAQLIRRGKRRNRPLWWHARRRMLQAVGVVVVIYGGLGLLLAGRHPHPSVDYVEELNRPLAATPLADRAWPIYRDAWTKARIWDSKDNDDDALYVKDPKGERGRFLRPGDARWPEAVAFLRQQKAVLDGMREGGLKSSLGWEFKTGDTLDVLSPEDRTVFRGNTNLVSRPARTGRAQQLADQAVGSVLLPYLAPLRHMANPLAADMRLAASEGDADRVLADYRALAGMARQCGQSSIIVDQRVGLGILAVADQAVMDINQHMPQSLLSRRVDLLHAMVSATPTWKIAIDGQRLMLLDIIQRVYSDNGKGDGRLTLDGLQVMAQMLPGDRATAPVMLREPLLLPAAAAMMGSRRDMVEQADRLCSLAEEDAARPLWVKLRSPGKADALIGRWKTSSLSGVRYPLLLTLSPLLEKAGIRLDTTRALHEAAMVALVLEAYRDKAGQYPASLSELVPHYLPVAPIDHSTGGPLRYKLVEGKPLLYGLGKDGADDGGVWTDKSIHWQPQVPEIGDWVLYPPVETE